MTQDISNGVSASHEVAEPVIVVSLMSLKDAQARSLGRGALRHGLLVGALAGNRWLRRDEAAKLVVKGQPYQLCGPIRLLGASSGGRSLYDNEDGSVVVRLSQRPTRSVKAKIIAVAGATHAVLPRWPTRVESTDQDRAAAREILVRHRVAPSPQLSVRTHVVDLDGDGASERVIQAKRLDLGLDPEVETDGQYSFVALVVENDTGVEVHELRGFFGRETEMPPTEFTLTHALDLDGDQILELVIEGTYHEGGGVDVFQVRRGEPPTRRLSSWWGL